MPYANNKGADQPAHLRSLISTFVVRCLDSMICILAISKVSRYQLASVAEQAGLNLTWLKIPKDMFSRDVAHIKNFMLSSWCLYFCLSLLYPLSYKAFSLWMNLIMQCGNINFVTHLNMGKFHPWVSPQIEWKSEHFNLYDSKIGFWGFSKIVSQIWK